MMNILLTTKRDWSREFFEGWKTVFYEELGNEGIGNNLCTEKCAIFYVRDPFNAPASYVPSPKLIDDFLNMVSAGKWIDGVQSFVEMLKFEDKFLQYEKYKKWMIRTEAVSFAEGVAKFVEGENILKPRISQRAKNIVMTSGDLIKVQEEMGWKNVSGGWILQERIDIKEELRVYAVRGELIRTASIKTSKQSGKVKVIGVRELSDREVDFCREIIDRDRQLDFVGLDVAVLQDGGLKLIEVNRSPQFKRFTELTGINLGEKLEQGVL